MMTTATRRAALLTPLVALTLCAAARADGDRDPDPVILLFGGADEVVPVEWKYARELGLPELERVTAWATKVRHVVLDEEGKDVGGFVRYEFVTSPDPDRSPRATGPAVAARMAVLWKCLKYPPAPPGYTWRSAAAREGPRPGGGYFMVIAAIIDGVPGSLTLEAVSREAVHAARQRLADDVDRHYRTGKWRGVPRDG